MKITAIFLITILFVFTFANDYMQPAQIAKDSYYQGMRFGRSNVLMQRNSGPEYSFIPNGDGESTTYLTSSYYDYMPFSYNGYNLRKQPAISQPGGYPADGWYVSYMRSETQSVGSDRRAYYSYINSDGTLGESNNVNSQPNREGFTSLAIDPYTGDPFVVWHALTEPDGSLDCHMTYAIYHITGTPGSWRTPFIVIDNPEMSQPFTGHDDDVFIFPQVHVGPSPLAGHRRVHVYGNNYIPYGGGPNSLYLYADFTDEDLMYTSDLDWTVQSFPYFDELAYNNLAMINKDMIVSEVDGKVIFFGNVADSLFAMYSDDYGETFTKYAQQLKQPMDNPTNQNPPYDPVWENDDGSPAEMFIIPSYDLSHYNGIFTDSNTKIQWMSGVNYNSQENMNGGTYWPAYIYPKIFTFDTNTSEFSFYDLDVQDTDPGDDHLAVAFDLDDDGEVDEYDEDGWPIIAMSCPSWFFNSDGGWQDSYFHESNCKMVSNPYDWIVCLWHDSAKLQNAFYEVPGYAGWVEQPEIALVISYDAGITWSDIRYINANPNDNVVDPENHYDGNYAPELEGMLPVNVSLGDKLEVLSNLPDLHAKLDFVFMNDGDYGSAVQGHGSFTNNTLHYAAIDINFNPASINEETIPTIDVQLFNYPNPFNPTTTISFSTLEESKVGLSIYNMKGQHVKTLLNEQLSVGQHSVIWDGSDSNGKRVGSGIYFYKMKTGNFQQTKKMILLK
ncbi:MAG: T9SS type A sorting domain-containing protein [Candidatus Cloacimonetes bacterium]|nr:T9SS type A sorting domain-containing protein [Candidatus Cloacimonadota bacterium]